MSATETEQAEASGRGRWKEQKGMALVFALLGITLLSMLAASLMFVTSAGSFGSVNFKNQVQATFAANAGEQVALDWFRTKYDPWLNDPGVNATTTYTNDPTTTYPLYGTSPVALGTGANFPTDTGTGCDGTTCAASFANIATGSLQMGNTGTSYTMTAQLLYHDTGGSIGGSTTYTNNTVINERWQIKVTGNVDGTPFGTSAVQETAVIERFYVPMFNNAIRANCDLQFNGAVTTDSYYSVINGVTTPYGSTSGGVVNQYTGAGAGASIASNSYLEGTGGSAQINGNAYYGTATGGCSCGAGGCANVPTGDIRGQILQAPATPFPTVPAWYSVSSDPPNSCTAGTNYVTNGVTTAAYLLSSTNTSVSGGAIYPSSLAQMNASGCCLQGGTACTGGGGVRYLWLCANPSPTTTNYFFNTVDMGANAAITIVSCTTVGGVAVPSPCAGTNCGPIQIFANRDLNLGGGGIAGMNPGVPGNLSVIYTGTNTSTFNGTSSFYGTIYAPNATVNLAGNVTIFGAVSANSVSDAAGAVHYDLTLLKKNGNATTFRIVNQTRNVF